MKFTKATVAALTMPAGKTEYLAWDDDLPGFGIRLRGGTRRWIAQFRIGRRQRRESLGDTRKVTLEHARKIARERFAVVELGRDPVAEKIKAEGRARLTLGYCADRYLAVKEGTLRLGTYKQTKLHLTVHWKSLRNQPLHEITRADVAVQLAKLATERGRVAAGRARTNLSTFFSWAMKEGLCEHNPVIVTNNPEKGIEPRARALDDRELCAVWRVCGDDDIVRIARLLLLTGCRRAEIGQLQRSEIDPATGIMSIPGTRTKTKRPLVLTLPPVALEILGSAPKREDRDYFFGVRGKGYSCWSQGKAQLDARILAATGKALAPWRWHDLRRTMRSGLGRLGVRPDVAERAVGHVQGKVEEIYDRYQYAPEIAQALALWAEHVLALVEGRKVISGQQTGGG